MTASSRGWTPLFLKDEPHSTGVSLVERVAARIAFLSTSTGTSCSFEDQLEQSVVVVGDLLEQVLAGAGGRFREVLRDLDRLPVPCPCRPCRRWPSSSTRSITPRKSPSAPIGSWIGTGWAPRRSIIVCTPMSKSAPVRSILLMKAMRGTWYLSAWRQTVSDCGSHAGHRVEQRDRAVEHAQRALDLDREVDVARRVDDVDAVVLPLAGGRGRGDRDASLLLLLHPVHDRRALVDLADLVGAPRVVEDALGSRRLTGVDVRHDPDVAGVLK